jgi:gamma-glutamyltranspeptidase/glutathione hydrolase
MAVFVKELVSTAGGLVAAQSIRAAAAGAEVLRAGGNAVDAAVATALALGVREPWMSGIGGGCAAVIHPHDGEPVAVDGGMLAPRTLVPGAYPLTGRGTGPGFFAWPEVEDDRNVTGPLAVAVPGLVAALGRAHARFGRLPWREAVAPAIAVADAGHEVDWYTALIVASGAAALRAQPAAAAQFLPDGLPPSPDWRKGTVTLDTSALARTYRALAEAGAQTFYTGDLAARWLGEARAAGTWLTAEDLAAYEARLVAPRRFRYRDAELHVMDGLFAGPSLERAFAAAGERWSGGAPDAAAYAAYAHGLKTAYTDRLETMGHAADPGHTTHFSIVDGDGTAVAWTQTLLSLFGANVLLPDTGILLNNGIMWFDPRPGTPNALAPGAKPLANMCPTLIATGDGRRVALGASGGRRILPAVMQLASFLIDAGEGLAQAFARPRIDVSDPAAAAVDPRLGEEVRAAVADVLPTTVVPEAVYPAPYAIPTALAVAPDGTRTAMGARVHPWAGAVAG